MNAPPMNPHVETISKALADLDRDGFAILKDLFTVEQLDELTAAMETLQGRVASGDLDPWFAGNEFVSRPRRMVLALPRAQVLFRYLALHLAFTGVDQAGQGLPEGMLHSDSRYAANT